MCPILHCRTDGWILKNRQKPIPHLCQHYSRETHPRLRWLPNEGLRFHWDGCTDPTDGGPGLFATFFRHHGLGNRIKYWIWWENWDVSSARIYTIEQSTLPIVSRITFGIASGHLPWMEQETAPITLQQQKKNSWKMTGWRAGSSVIAGLLLKLYRFCL